MPLALSSHRVCAVALVSLLALAVACSERGPGGAGTVPTLTGQLVACMADLRSATLSCDAPSGPSAGRSTSGFSRDLIVGGQGTNVELRSTNRGCNAATGVLLPDVTVQNLRTCNLGP